MAKPVYSKDWPKVRLAILERDRWLCQLRLAHCKIKATEVDHIVPVDVGGSWRNPANLRSVCRPCHNGRKGRTLVVVQPGPGPQRDW